METIGDLEVKLKNYEQLLSGDNESLFIVDVPGYTVGMDVDGGIIIEETDYPTRFTETGLKKVLESKNITVEPRVHTSKSWYRGRIEYLKENIRLLKMYGI